MVSYTLYLIEIICPELTIKKLMCQRQSFIKDRAPLEDNAYVIMEYDTGAIGHMWCSSINIGSSHGLKFRIVGDKASISWWQERPNILTYEKLDEPVRILERGKDYLCPEALSDDRCGGGHMEGFFEAWANIYYRFAQAIEAKEKGDKEFLKDFWYPTVEAGRDGVYWLNKCVESANTNGNWIDY